MFNVYKNQESRQIGSRNPMGSKTLPTIWGTYMTLVTQYQISVIKNCFDIYFDNYFTVFGAVLTTVLPVLFKYCYKYCYSDSWKL